MLNPSELNLNFISGWIGPCELIWMGDGSDPSCTPMKATGNLAKLVLVVRDLVKFIKTKKLCFEVHYSGCIH